MSPGFSPENYFPFNISRWTIFAREIQSSKLLILSYTVQPHISARKNDFFFFFYRTSD